MKKQISILLLCAMLLAGCGQETGNVQPENTQNDENTGNTESVMETEPTIYDSLVTEDFAGYTFNILNVDSNYAYVFMTTEELTGETINDTVYNRDITVGDRLNVNFGERITTWADIYNEVQALILAGDNAYDIYFAEAWSSLPFMTDGYAADLWKTELQLDMPWWDAGAIETLSIGDHLYRINGDLHLMYSEASWIFYVNKQMLENYDLESPYTLVREDKWTLDKAGEMIEAATQDLNGDGKMNTDDQFGLTTHNNCVCTFVIGGGQSLLTKNADNIPEWTPLSEVIYDISAKVREVVFDLNHTYIENVTPTGTRDVGIVGHFMEGGDLFLCEVLGHAKTLRSMDNDFGILPIPKYSETVKGYRTYVAGSAQVMMIPTSADEEALHRTAIVLDNLGAESFRTLRPAYFDVQLNGKTIRDEDSRDMLDIIFADRRYEMAYMFGLNDLVSAYGNAARNGSDLSSAVAKIEDKCKAALADTLSALGE